MDYSSLILMERDNETGFVSKEVGSFQVSEGAEFVKNFYVKGDEVYFVFDTKEDVEEWQYSAIYDLFDYEVRNYMNSSSFPIIDFLNATTVLRADIL